MIPIISVPASQSNFSPTSSVAAMVASASEVAVGRMPVTAVAASVMLPELNNNNRGMSPARFFGNDTPAPAPEKTFTPGLASKISTPTLNASGSTLFLAQLLGQAGSNMPTLSSAGNFVDYSTFVQYSYVKYRPSDAAIPRPETLRVNVNDNGAPSAADQIRLAARAAAQQLEAANAARQQQAAPPPQATGSNSSAEAVAVAQSQPALPEQKAANAPKLPAKGGAALSLITKQGMNAYIATATRNHSELGEPKPQGNALKVAL